MRSLRTGRRLARWALLLLAVATAASIGAAQTKPLRLVSTAWPPFTNQPGQPRFALDLVETALGRIGVTSTTTIVEAAQFTASLLKGDFDGSAAAWKDAERERVLLFSKPYLENRLILVGRKGADVSAGSAGRAHRQADCDRRRLCLRRDGRTRRADVRPVAQRGRQRGATVERQRRLRADGRPGRAVHRRPPCQGGADQAAARDRRRFVTRQLYFAVRRGHPDAQSIIDRFNAQLRGMIADHTYHRLLHVDWIQADVDDDGLLEYVPRSDQAGTTEPQRAYSIFSAPQLSTPQPAATNSRRPALLRRRQHLSRLGDGAGHLQADGTADGESRSLHRHDLPFRLVASAGPAEPAETAGPNPGVCHRDGPADGR